MVDIGDLKSPDRIGRAGSSPVLGSSRFFRDFFCPKNLFKTKKRRPNLRLVIFQNLFYLAEKSCHLVAPFEAVVPVLPLNQPSYRKVAEVMRIVKMQNRKPPLPDVSDLLVRAWIFFRGNLAQNAIEMRRISCCFVRNSTAYFVRRNRLSANLARLHVGTERANRIFVFGSFPLKSAQKLLLKETSLAAL